MKRKTFLQRCDEKAAAFLAEWHSEDSQRRGKAVEALARGRGNRTLVAAIVVKLAMVNGTAYAAQLVGALSYVEETMAMRKRGK
jgi:hypothetical protein